MLIFTALIHTGRYRERFIPPEWVVVYPKLWKKVQRFRVQRFKVQRFRVQRFRVQRFRVQRFRVQGSGFRVQRFRVQRPERSEIGQMWCRRRSSRGCKP